jgi:hypothetical protein
MTYSRLVAIVLAVWLCGCTGPMRKGAIIDKYTRAQCVPVRFGPGITPPTRAWDHNLTLRGGGGAHISGQEMPGGQIDVRFQPDGSEQVAVDPGDYIYPADVREWPGSGCFARNPNRVAVGRSCRIVRLVDRLNTRREVLLLAAENTDGN